MLLGNNFHLLITSSTNNLQPNHPTTSRRKKRTHDLTPEPTLLF